MCLAVKTAQQHLAPFITVHSVQGTLEQGLPSIRWSMPRQQANRWYLSLTSSKLKYWLLSVDFVAWFVFHSELKLGIMETS